MRTKAEVPTTHKVSSTFFLIFSAFDSGFWGKENIQKTGIIDYVCLIP